MPSRINLNERKKITLAIKDALGCSWKEAMPFINEQLAKEEMPTWQSVDTMKAKCNQAKRDNPEAIDPITKELADKSYNVDNVKEMWIKEKHYSVKIIKPTFDYKGFIEELGHELEIYTPKYYKIERKPITDGHLLVIEASDIHLGKLSVPTETGENYDLDIAYNKVIQGLSGLLEKAKGFPIDQILLPIGNDILHVDNPFHKTTAGTNQDTSCMWHEAFMKGIQLYSKVIETLLPIANVHVVFNPSNHDFQSGFMLAQVIQSHFRTSPNITFDCDMKHRKYYQYGSNLIGTSHGDGAKENNLGLLMATEAKALWSATEHRYLYLHHIHHKKQLDGIGHTIEYMRSASATDSWHNRQGFVGTPQGIEGFIHHKIDGRVCSLFQTVK